MGIFSFLFGKKGNERKTDSSECLYETIIDNGEQSGTGDREFDKLERLREKFYDYVDEIDEDFQSCSYTERMRRINKYLKTYQTLEDYTYQVYGKSEKTFEMELAEFNADIPVEVDLDKSWDIESPDFEFDDYIDDNNWGSVVYVKRLKELYESQPERVKAFIQREQAAIERERYESYKDYLEALQFEKDWEKAKRNIRKYITDHDGVLQSEIVSMYDERYKKRIYNFIGEMAEKGKLEKRKSGHSYSLHIKK